MDEELEPTNWDGSERRQDAAHALRSELLSHIKAEESTFMEFRADIKCLRDSVDEYKPYLDMAIRRECRRERFHRAVIEKTAVALAWTILAGVGWLLYEGLLAFFKNVSMK